MMPDELRSVALLERALLHAIACGIVIENKCAAPSLHYRKATDPYDVNVVALKGWNSRRG